MKNALHHEEHEDFSWGCATLGDQQQGELNFGSNLLFFFAAFVSFVVQMGNLG